jgi:hypothetical protein
MKLADTSSAASTIRSVIGNGLETMPVPVTIAVSWRSVGWSGTTRAPLKMPSPARWSEPVPSSRTVVAVGWASGLFASVEVRETDTPLSASGLLISPERVVNVTRTTTFWPGVATGGSE